MMKIKSFEHLSAWGSVNDTVEEVNNEIQILHNRGAEFIELDIASTGKGIIYTLIWYE